MPTCGKAVENRPLRNTLSRTYVVQHPEFSTTLPFCGKLAAYEYPLPYLRGVLTCGKDSWVGIQTVESNRISNLEFTVPGSGNKNYVNLISDERPVTPLESNALITGTRHPHGLYVQDPKTVHKTEFWIRRVHRGGMNYFTGGN